MQTSKQEKKAGVRRPDVRSLKIQPRIRDNRWSRTTAPEIKLCGSWLEQLGFHYGKRVVVTTMKELLIIRLQSE
jgi:toxic protein SymE